MNEKIIEEVRKRLREERSKFIECTRKRQFDIALIHSVRIDMLYYFLKLLQGGEIKNE